MAEPTVERVLLVDLDDTLVDRSAAFRAWAYDFAAEHDRRDDATWLVQADRRGLRPRPELAALITERFALGDRSADDVLTTLRRGLVERMVLGTETAAALGAVRDHGWPIVIVTNGTASQQTAKITHLGLDRLVDGWVISEAAGVRKPDPAIFHRAAALVSAPLAGWMVGDSAEADIAGGRGVGLSTAWIRCGRTWSAPDGAPEVEANSFADAAQTILRPCSGSRSRSASPPGPRSRASAPGSTRR